MNPIQSWTFWNDSKDYLDMQLKRNFILQIPPLIFTIKFKSPHSTGC